MDRVIDDFRWTIDDCRSLSNRRSIIGNGEPMTPRELQIRTKAFALRVITLVDTLPRSTAGQIIGRQLLRSATSVGANYRAACRAQSRAEFAAKLSVVLEEADETLYWLELLQESTLIKAERLTELMKEANELVAISVAARKTAKRAA
jgi:four helix bundle protein